LHNETFVILSVYNSDMMSLSSSVVMPVCEMEVEPDICTTHFIVSNFDITK